MNTIQKILVNLAIALGCAVTVSLVCGFFAGVIYILSREGFKAAVRFLSLN